VYAVGLMCVRACVCPDHRIINTDNGDHVSGPDNNFVNYNNNVMLDSGSRIAR